jgi:hypothetical protein
LFIDKNGLACCLYCIALRVFDAVLVVFPGVSVKLAQFFSGEARDDILKEIYQTLLTNKKQGNLD